MVVPLWNVKYNLFVVEFVDIKYASNFIKRLEEEREGRRASVCIQINSPGPYNVYMWQRPIKFSSTCDKRPPPPPLPSAGLGVCVCAGDYWITIMRQLHLSHMEYAEYSNSHAVDAPWCR